MKNNCKQKDLNWLFLCIIIILSVCFYDLHNINSIGIIPDELGYWAPAAMINGEDWSAAMRTTPYYSFMYGIFLVPIYTLFADNSVYMYRGAVVFNSFLLIICFFCTYFFLNWLNNKKIKSRNYWLASLFISVYPAHLLFSKTTLSENLLLLCTWLIILTFVNYLQYSKLCSILLMGILAFVGYYTHQRFLIIIISLLLTLIIDHIHNKRLKKEKIIKITIILIFVGCLFVWGEHFKYIYKEWAYPKITNGIEQTNDYGSVMNSAISLLSIDRLKQYFFSVVGKLFYAGVATYGLLFCGILTACESIFKFEKGETKKLISIFLLLSYFGSVLLSALVMNHIPQEGDRFDTLIYGRYSEHLHGPVLAIAINLMLQNYDKFVKFLSYSFILQICFFRIIQNIIIDTPNYSVQWLSCSALNEFFYNDNILSLNESFLLIILRNGLFVFGVIVFKNISNNSVLSRNIALLLGIVTYIYSAIYTVNHTHFDYRQSLYEDNCALKKIIMSQKIDNTIYSFEDKHISALQFIVPNIHFEHVVNIKTVEGGNLVVTPSDFRDNEELILLKKATHLSIWKKAD